MSETLHSPLPLSIDEYQTFVLGSRRGEYDPADWAEVYHDKILDEFGELNGQHGMGMFLLKSYSEARDSILEETPEVIEGAKEEIGDLIWFGVSAADHLGATAKELCLEALTARTGETDIRVETFSDLQKEVAPKADKIRVLTKGGMRYPHLPEKDRYANLFESPDYLLSRAVFRVARSLTDGSYDTPPYTASMMEPLVNPRFAVGEYLNILVYAARRMGLDIDEIIRLNIHKLQLRKAESLST